MAATQVFLALCVAGVAVAAPQQSRSAAISAGSDGQVVTSVIASLTPAIAKAVEEALAALNSQAAAEAEALRVQQEQEAAAAAAAAAAAEAEALRIQQEQQAAAAAEAEALRIQQEQQAAAAAAAAAEQLRQQQLAEQRRQQQLAEERRQQQIAEANAAAAAAALEKASFETDVSADLGPFTRPVYNFEYKVADETAQTYISRNEERDGSELTGSYSYVDATGALVKVDYTAGVNGYNEVRTVEAGFVTPRVIPPWTGPLAGIDDASTATGSILARAPAPVAVARPVTRVRVARPVARVSSSSSSESDLIARILAALTPQINSAVTAALA